MRSLLDHGRQALRSISFRTPARIPARSAPLVAALAVAVVSATASAQPKPIVGSVTCDDVKAVEKKGEKKESGLDKSLKAIDKTFGSIFVGPLASVLFFDLLATDNEVDKETAKEIVGQVIRGKEYIGWDATSGKFTTVKRYAMNVGRLKLAPEEKKIPVAPKYRTAFGEVRVAIENGLTPDSASAVVLPGPLTVGGRKATSLADWKGAPLQLGTAQIQAAVTAAPQKYQVIEAAAPFPVLVEMVGEGEAATTMLVSTRVPAKPLVIPAPPPPVRSIGPDEKVWVGDNDCNRSDVATIVNISEQSGISMAELRSEATAEEGGNPLDRKLPFIVVWLVLGALFFTLRMSFINFRGMRHALDVVRGQYDDPEHEGEISHFQALSSALSATVGLGNIAGVAIAVGVGGPGAVFWMVVAGVFGMASKFVECTLGQMYRHVDDSGIVLGGPMRYLRVGLDHLADDADKSGGNSGGILRPLGMVLSVLFAVMCIGGSFGGGNMFQANQAFAAVSERIPALAEYNWAFGIVMAILVGLVIIGGIKRIGAAAGFLVPLMCGLYLLAGAYILIVNAGNLGWAFGVIIGEAFDPMAGIGGLVGVLIIGFQRAAFSNEAGVGSAAIAHSAAATNEPVSEGIVALLEPFIDTILVCTMTGLVVVVTGAYLVPDVSGVVMTSIAFEQALPWFPWVLTVAVVLFAFSTMISWSYYGERSATRLFGPKISLPYRAVFCLFVFFGAVFELGNVLTFSDLMVLGMAFPNILGAVLLSGKVKGALDDYWGRYKSGQLKKYSE